jgi:tetratricopeptide (TPR) repeat protein
VGEAAAVGLFLKGYALIGILLHAGCAFALSLLSSGIFVFYLCLSFFVPVLGVLGLLLLSFYARGKRARVSPLHLDMDDDTTTVNVRSRIPDVAKYLSHYNRIEPLVDILRSEDARMKRYSIEQLASQRTSRAIRLLKEANHDSDGSIRLFASTALIKIEQELNDQVQALREESEQSPDNPDVFAGLASAYFQFCYLDLLDELSTRYYAQLAIEACQKSLARDETQYDVWVLLGKIHIENEDFAKAESCFRKAVSIDPSCADAYGWWAECLYFLGVEAELVQCCRRLLELGVEDDRLRETVMWWAGDRRDVA